MRTERLSFVHRRSRSRPKSNATDAARTATLAVRFMFSPASSRWGSLKADPAMDTSPDRHCDGLASSGSLAMFIAIADHALRRLKLTRMAIAHAHARTQVANAMSRLEAKKRTMRQRHSKQT